MTIFIFSCLCVCLSQKSLQFNKSALVHKQNHAASMLKLGSEEQVGWLCAPVFTWLVCRNISDDSVKLFSFFLESTNPFCFPASNVLNVLMIFFFSAKVADFVFHLQMSCLIV